MTNTAKNDRKVNRSIIISVILVLAAVTLIYIFVFDPIVNVEDYNMNIGWIDSYAEITQLLQNGDHNFILPDEALILQYAESASYKQLRKGVLFKRNSGYWIQSKGNEDWCPQVKCWLTKEYEEDRGRVLDHQEEYMGAVINVCQPKEGHYTVVISMYECTYEIQSHDQAICLEFAKNIVDNAAQ